MHKIFTIVINTIRGFANPIFNFITIAIGISQFGKEDWGILINILLWIFFLSFIAGWGNKEFLIRKFSTSPSTIYNDFYLNFFSRSIFLILSPILFFFFPPTISFLSFFLLILFYCYQSLDSLVVYHQVFFSQLIAESLGFLIVLVYIIYAPSFKLSSVLLVYCLAFTIKLCYLIYQLKLWKTPITFHFSIKDLYGSLYFFLLGFSGWLLSKIDIYIASYYLPKARLSEYQLLITAFLMLQAISALVVVPFTKHIYRLPKNSTIKLKFLLNYIALPLIGIGTFIIWLVLEYIIHLEISLTAYILGGTMTLPSFFYIIDIYEYYKIKQEKKIIIFNFSAAILNFILILLLINTYQFIGILISNCIIQWVLLIIYKTHDKNPMSYMSSKN